MIDMSHLIALKSQFSLKSSRVALAFESTKKNRPLKGTGAKRDVCPAGSSVSAGAKFPVASAESAPMVGAPIRTPPGSSVVGWGGGHPSTLSERSAP